jgi:Ser/Thr protein kinase RdoA (MazF antagonist)
MNAAVPVYADLSPDLILDAVETKGFVTNGHLLALNSYENRVYQIGLEDRRYLVAKFYRPGRWEDAAILEEHAFAQELVDVEIPVVAPLADDHGNTLFAHAGFRFALYPRRGGRWPDLDNPDNLEWLGRYLGRIHAVGGIKPFTHRPTLDTDSLGTQSYRYLLEGGFIPTHIELAYRTLAEDLLTAVDAAYQRAGDVAHIRLHGDCHPGNILWTDEGPHFVDLDDCRMGPAVQDMWMLLSGDRQEMGLQLSEIVAGYELFRDFDRRELLLIEALRTLRMLHYAAWLARRWEDPAFPQAFPWFNTSRYWEEHVLQLREQAAALQEPALVI